MAEDTLEALRADHKSLEALVLERMVSLQREMRAGFQGINLRFDAEKADSESVNARFDGVNARFDGLESEVRFGFEKIDRLEARLDSMDSRLANIERMLATALNGKERR
jgi:hypothetical protein